MKTLTSLKKYFFLAIVSALTANAQALSPGDIAIIGFNYDNPDQIAFVALAEIPSGTVIKFTDNGWKSDGTFRASEGTYTYTAASTIAAGTVVDPGISGPALSSSGDQVLAYQGDNSSPTFIYAINSDGSSGTWQSDATSASTSALPTGLTNNTDAIAFVERDNGYYSGTTTGTKAELLTAISDPANWTTNNGRIDSSNWVAAFTVSGGGDPGTTTPGLLLSQSDGSTDVTEGGASDSFDVALSTLPSNDVTVTLTPGADVDLGSGAGVAIDLSFTTVDGTSAQTVTVTAFDDSDIEGTEVSAISISSASSDADYNDLSDQVDVNVSDNDFTPSGDLIISQYYEGSSSNKYIEVTNIGDSSIDLTGYSIVSWNNSLSEEYKTATGLPDGNDAISLDLTSLGSIEPGQTMVFTNTSAVSPIASGNADLSLAYPSPFHFNGNDSVVIYSSATPNPANIVDAIGFTTSNEGKDKSFVRAGAYKGYDLLAGSNASSSQFDGIWTEITNATADAASYGDDEYIGTTALAVAPTAIGFTNTSIVVAEDDGGVTADLTIEILNPDGVNSVSVDVVLNSGTSTADAADIDSYTTQTVTFPSTAISGAQQVVTITVTDDSDVEVNEDAIFDLANVASSNTNVSIGAASSATLTIQDNDVVIPAIIISEVADPNDNANGRFVELYNATDSTVDLAAGSWYLTKYVNNNSSRSSVALTGSIAPGATYVIGGSGFNATYSPLTADQTWNDATSNGDDSYALYFGGDNTTGTLVDILGVIGTDGTGQVWNYEDGRAVRKADVTSPDDSLFASDWIFYSDESTSNQPLTNGVANVSDMTPGVHPDPLVDEPTGVTASAASDTEISVAFAAINSNDVIIVFDTDNTFTAPSGDAPSVGDSFAGGTVVYKGQVSPFAHTGLTASTQYYYSVFSVNGTDYSATTEINATTQVAGLIYSEDFNNVTVEADDWFNATVLGTDTWDLSQSTALIDGYTGQVDNGAENHYLVSPALDFSSETAITIRFDYEGTYDDSDSDSFELVYSTDYSGSGNPESTATWTEIAFDFSQNLQAAEPVALVNSGLVSIPAVLEGESTVYLAFRYSAGGGETTSESWELDNILIQSTTVAADPVADYLTLRSLTSTDLATDTNGNGFTVLEEYLAGFGDGSGPDVISYGIVDNALTLTSDLESAPSGITVVLQATSDLNVAFEPVAFTASVVDNGDTTYTRSYTETSPPAGDQRFLRLSITTD
jgi:hypothetical protein